MTHELDGQLLDQQLDEQLDPELEAVLDDDFSEEPQQTLDELAALAEAEATAADAEVAAQAEDLATARRELDVERAQARAAVERYREAVLAAEPELPPELVSGETLSEVDASLDAARRAVAQVRERMGVESETRAGFPVWAPARSGVSTAGMSAAEKIAAGLEQRTAAS
ncbi:MAG TPA: hypothetical protein QF624_02145 [Dehalococcoidia bacterium]|nr:hypothetical protein [Dehalococcoidia bacterium]